MLWRKMKLLVHCISYRHAIVSHTMSSQWWAIGCTGQQKYCCNQNVAFPWANQRECRTFGHPHNSSRTSPLDQNHSSTTATNSALSVANSSRRNTAPFQWLKANFWESNQLVSTQPQQSFPTRVGSLSNNSNELSSICVSGAFTSPQ